MSVDLLADAFNTIRTHEFVGQEECHVPSSKTVLRVLELLKSHGYVKDFIPEDTKIYVKLSGRINNCKVIKPRFPVKKDEWSKVEERYIPGVDIGLIIVSTQEGLITNRDASQKEIGGRIIAFVY
ncbi:30S ribosomal protein S8 [Candidatus Micrarchaeota archaeon]|nr:30S ribosomal protein S8 [Candidatus Micrarchaeota archaeon]